MVESEMLQGDQMALEIRVWERLEERDAAEYLRQKEGQCLTVKFRVLLHGSQLVVITACAYHPSRANGDSYLDTHWPPGARNLIETMLDGYRLVTEDRRVVEDELVAFLDEHMPIARPVVSAADPSA
jgi:hypothetical protein